MTQALIIGGLLILAYFLGVGFGYILGKNINTKEEQNGN
jgi:hypothetical protein